MQNGRPLPLYSKIRFLDSFQYMSQSFECLAKTMQTYLLQLLRNIFSDISSFDFENIRGKGFSPTIIWTTSKNFPRLLLLMGTPGETICLSKRI